MWVKTLFYSRKKFKSDIVQIAIPEVTLENALCINDNNTEIL